MALQQQQQQPQPQQPQQQQQQQQQHQQIAHEPQPPPLPQQPERKRVKVYELKNNDWYDRGTGFCSGQYFQSPGSAPDNPDARIVVVSEDEPSRTLLETKIVKDDGYQKQQETLIVWTEHNGVDMALSFQEAEGCAGIWEFVSDVQQKLATAHEDGLSDNDLLESAPHVILPPPELGKLEEIEMAVKAASTNAAARDLLAKFVMSQEQMYILRLTDLVEEAERRESLADLHRLCTIVKHFILLNDTSIIEHIVSDQAIMGVVGALEYDPDFPSHRANHRQYLSDYSRYREVIPITQPEIRKKIHIAYRLLYLKDVVLARILDDPTFGVLNSLIFFHQVDIINYLQANQTFLDDLFGLFADTADPLAVSKRKEAVLFIQTCCAVCKNVQVQSRAQLFHALIQHGLFSIIHYALRHHDAAVRVAGTDILVALIDHDPQMVRNQIFNCIREKEPLLTDYLIDLLQVEVDLGVKSQMADAIKILLDPSSTNGLEMMRAGQANGEMLAKRGGMANGIGPHGVPQVSPQMDAFIESFYVDSAPRLFKPLTDLEYRTDMTKLSVQQTSLLTHLVEILSFFVRQHTYRGKQFILSRNLHSRVAQLLECPQKYMKLTALKWFRCCVGLQDEFHNRQMMSNNLFEPILNIVYETMPRDNLLNSVCLELFEYIKRESVRPLIVHLVETYRERLLAITYVGTFQQLVLKYDQLQSGYVPSTNGAEDSSFTTQEGTPVRLVNGTRYAGLKEMDNDEEAYFDGDEDVENDDEMGLPSAAKVGLPNGAGSGRPLVDYPDDDDEDHAFDADNTDIPASSPDHDIQQFKKDRGSSSSDSDLRSDLMETELTSEAQTSLEGQERGRDRRPVPIEGSPGRQPSPPEPLAMKRRREEDDEDDVLGSLMGGTKRRNSTTSVSSQTRDLQLDGSSSPGERTSYKGDAPAVQYNNPAEQAQEQLRHLMPSQLLRRKGSFKSKNEGSAARFAIKPISISAKTEHNSKTATENGGSAHHAGDGGGGGVG